MSDPVSAGTALFASMLAHSLLRRMVSTGLLPHDEALLLLDALQHNLIGQEGKAEGFARETMRVAILQFQLAKKGLEPITVQ
jgi:hypothetical protein